MKKSIKHLVLLGSTLAFLFTAMSMTQKAGEPWNIPAKYKTMKSTVKAGAPSITAEGKELFNKHCKACHGAKGLGDGPKAASMKAGTGDFSSKAFQAQTDGEIYYQSFVGRGEMPNFEKKITDDQDRWAVVGYIRTMKK
ncbi:MAG: c-type cytochrome [Omnitrophica WOR_2 bacterium]|jgi:mono/diheme cytochrome c family protein